MDINMQKSWTKLKLNTNNCNKIVIYYIFNSLHVKSNSIVIPHMILNVKQNIESLNLI